MVFRLVWSSLTCPSSSALPLVPSSHCLLPPPSCLLTVFCSLSLSLRSFSLFTPSSSALPLDPSSHCLLPPPPAFLLYSTHSLSLFTFPLHPFFPTPLQSLTLNLFLISYACCCCCCCCCCSQALYSSLMLYSCVLVCFVCLCCTNELIK